MRNTTRKIPLLDGWSIALVMLVATTFGIGADCDTSATRAAESASDSPEARAHFFDGRLLSADDLNQEQDYLDDR